MKKLKHKESKKWMLLTRRVGIQSQVKVIHHWWHATLSWCACVLSRFSNVWLCDPWTVARQAPLSMGLPREEYWSGLPFPTPAQLPDPEIEPKSLMSPALAGGCCTTSATSRPNTMMVMFSLPTCALRKEVDALTLSQIHPPQLLYRL